MSVIVLREKKFELLLSEKEIQARIAEIADDIKNLNLKNPPLFVGILNGSFRFASDLIRNIDYPVEIEFINVSSYRNMKSTGEVKLHSTFGIDARGKDIIILEDIVDTGNTLEFIIPLMQSTNPESIRIATLLFKPEAYMGNYKVDFRGFEIPNEFVVGYGLDYDGLGRELNAIYQLKK